MNGEVVVVAYEGNTELAAKFILSRDAALMR